MIAPLASRADCSAGGNVPLKGTAELIGVSLLFVLDFCLIHCSILLELTVLVPFFMFY